LILLHISQREEDSQNVLPDARPYLYLGGFLLTSLAGVAIIAGWWAYVRAPDLVLRTDNRAAQSQIAMSRRVLS
jgi:hypothetical protein